MSRRLPAGNGVVGHDERDDPDRVLCGGVLVVAEHAVMRLNLVMVELRDYPKMRCLMLERTPLV